MAYQRIREAILAGTFAPGEKLLQEDVANRLGISRGPTREALNRLAVEGFVLQRPRRGYVVSSLDPDEVEDIFDIRMLLEERAGYVATKRRTEADIVAAEKLLHQLNGFRVVTTEDVERYAVLNRAFHARLFLPSGRPHLCRATALLRDQVERYVRFFTSTIEKTSEDDHIQIFEAFRRGDAELMGRLSRDHCRRVCARVIEGLRDARQRITPEADAYIRQPSLGRHSLPGGRQRLRECTESPSS